MASSSFVAPLNYSFHHRGTSFERQTASEPIDSTELGMNFMHNTVDDQSTFGLPSSGCVECVTDSCLESEDIERTAQCTDQCVVVACHDLNHSNGFDNNSQHPCFFSCGLSGEICANCSEFDELLQCCPELHDEHKHIPDYSWDPSLEAFFCSCGEQFQNGSESSSSASSTHFSTPQLNSHSAFSDSSYDVKAPSPLLLPVASQAAFSMHPPQMTCMWGECDATFSSLEELVGHVNIQHLRRPAVVPPAPTQLQMNEQSLACLWKDCNDYYSPNNTSSGNQIDQSLASHLLQDHLGCSIHQTPVTPCEPSPPVSDAHECSGIHQCKWRECGEVFESCEALTTHLTTFHVGGGKAHYECFWDDCKRHGEAGFTSKQKICRHLQSHTGHRPFKCEICSQNFSEAATLQQHMRRHTLEKPYVCDYAGCGKSFAITGALTIHKRMHNGDKPFKCTYCDRAFAESSNLSKHLRTHTGARPYPCTECDKRFARPDQLTRHIGVHSRRKGGSKINPL